MGQIDRRIFGAAVIGLLGASLSAAELTQEEAAYLKRIYVQFWRSVASAAILPRAARLAAFARHG